MLTHTVPSVTPHTQTISSRVCADKKTAAGCLVRSSFEPGRFTDGGDASDATVIVAVVLLAGSVETRLYEKSFVEVLG